MDILGNAPQNQGPAGVGQGFHGEVGPIAAMQSPAGRMQAMAPGAPAALGQRMGGPAGPGGPGGPMQGPGGAQNQIQALASNPMVLMILLRIIGGALQQALMQHQAAAQQAQSPQQALAQNPLMRPLPGGRANTR